MKSLQRLIISYISNFIAFIIASYTIPGFEVTNIFRDLLWLVAIFTLLNILIRPVVKSLLTPLIILTLGLFIIAINAGMLWLLDFLSQHITINGTLPLVYTTLIISLINIILSLSAKSTNKQQP